MLLPMRVTLKGRCIMIPEEPRTIDYKKLGARIKAFRAEKGLSQEELSQLVDIDFRHVSNIENGRTRPSLKILISIANALEVSADDILSDSLDYSKSTAGTEIHDILMDCNPDEKKMLLKILRFMKALLTEFGI